MVVKCKLALLTQCIMVLFTTATFSSTSTAQMIGETKAVEWDVVRQNVSYPNSKSGEEVYQTDKGWYVTDIKEGTYGGYGRKGYSTSKFAALSDMIEEQRINESFESAIREANKSNDADSAKSIEKMKKYYLDTFRRIRTSHSTVKVKWNVKHDGNEFNKKGGSINLSMKLTTVRYATPKEIDIFVNSLKKRIQQGKSVQPVIGQQFDHAVLRSEGLPPALIVNGKRLQFASDEVVSAISGRNVYVSSEFYHSFPYGASIQRGQKGFVTAGYPGCWVCDENGSRWPISGPDPLSLNGTELVNVSVQDYNRYKTGGHIKVKP